MVLVIALYNASIKYNTEHKSTLKTFLVCLFLKHATTNSLIFNREVQTRATTTCKLQQHNLFFRNLTLDLVVRHATGPEQLLVVPAKDKLFVKRTALQC